MDGNYVVDYRCRGEWRKLSYKLTERIDAANFAFDILRRRSDCDCVTLTRVTSSGGRKTASRERIEPK